MSKTTAVVIGAGHCGLAMSSHLAAHSIDHVVLERGEVAHSWRTQRWDSLRLLTPNWLTRLPGWQYDGDEPGGYLSAQAFADVVADYASRSGAPVVSRTTVTAVRPGDPLGFEVVTDRGSWRCRAVVLATGMTRTSVPANGRRLPAAITSIPALAYRGPRTVPDGGVLVVGASASGVQIAEELRRSGRDVTLSVGEHVRLPRRYLGEDIFTWLEATGVLDARWDEVDDLVRARHVPSPQLVGAERTVDLNALQDAGVQLVGRFAGIRDDVALFSGSLANVTALADLKLGRLLDTIDAHVGTRGERPEPTRVPTRRLSIDLSSGEFSTVVWATGLRAEHSMLDVPVFDHRGRMRHEGGVTSWPGLYVMGLPFLRSRRSTYIAGADADAHDLTQHLRGYLGHQRSEADRVGPGRHKEAS